MMEVHVGDIKIFQCKPTECAKEDASETNVLNANSMDVPGNNNEAKNRAPKEGQPFPLVGTEVRDFHEALSKDTTKPTHHLHA